MDRPWGGEMKHDKINGIQQKSAGEQDPREDQPLILCLFPLKIRGFPHIIPENTDSKTDDPFLSYRNVLAVNIWRFVSGFISSCWGSTSVCCDSKPTAGETFIAPTVGLMQYTCNNNLRVMRTPFGEGFIVAGLLNEKRRGPIRCHKTLFNNQRLHIPAVRHVWGSLQESFRGWAETTVERPGSEAVWCAPSQRVQQPWLLLCSAPVQCYLLSDPSAIDHPQTGAFVFISVHMSGRKTQWCHS